MKDWRCGYCLGILDISNDVEVFTIDIRCQDCNKFSDEGDSALAYNNITTPTGTLFITEGLKL